VSVLKLAHTYLKIAIFAFVFGGLISASAPSWAQTGTGSISAISGSATIARGTTTIPATYGAAVQIGDKISTGPDGRVTVTLTDGSQLELSESSSLVVTQNDLNPNGTRANTKITVLGGLVRSLVRFTAGTPPNFEVHTPNAVASARGTTYDTGYENGVNRDNYQKCKEFTDVSVYEGTVEVANPTNPSAPPVDVHSGQKTTVPCGLAVLPASAAAAAGAGGLGVGTAVGAALGAAAVVGGTVGGLAGAGAIGGGSSGGSVPPQKPSSPGQ
jgi:ferric-dicitrate binding protein FerR (iron transport regulator)